MKITNALRELGLGENEAAVYLFLAQNGPSYATQIQAAVELDKVPVYRALSALRGMGYVESIGETRNQQFEACATNQLLDKYDWKLNELSNARRGVEVFVGGLADRQRDWYKEKKISLYEGKDGFRLWNEERLGSGAELIREFGSNSFLKEFFAPDEFDVYMKQYIRRRVDLGIQMQSLQDEHDLRDFDASDERLLKEQRVISVADLVGAYVSVFGSRFGYYSMHAGRYQGVIVDDPMLSNVWAVFFDVMWANGRKV